MLYEEYAARVCDDGRVQTVKEHLLGVEQLAIKDAVLLKTKGIIRLIAKLHDMGKNTALSNKYQHTVGANLKWEGETIAHAIAGGRYIYERLVVNNSNRNAIDILLAEIISIAIMSHHGLFDCYALSCSSEKSDNNKFAVKLKNTSYDYDEAKSVTFNTVITEEEIGRLLDDSKRELAEILRSIKGTDKVKERVFNAELALFERILLSVIVNSDHTNAAEYCNKIKIPSVYGETNMWCECINYLENKIKDFDNTKEINKIRSEISDKAVKFSDKASKIIKMSVPTGGGKTISGLRYALNYAAKFNKSRIIYVAPFNSILEQNYNEFREYLPENMDVLPHFGDMITYENSDKKYMYFTENWGSPVITTSMVQFLNTIYDGRITSIRRMRGLINSVIILDEVQSVPVECTTLFNIAVKFLADVCGCTIVLCSATQPVFDQIRYSVPLDEESEMVSGFDSYCKKLKRTEIVDKIKYDGGYSFEDASEFIVEMSEQNSSLLCVVNTKKAAAKIYAKVREIIEISGRGQEYIIVHLSTYMCPEHRKNVIDKLKNSLSDTKKNPDTAKKVICISTQLIEAGVDISFSTVIRSVAGLDSIIQSAGRCNRNAETDIGFVYVINIVEENMSYLKSIRESGRITANMFSLIKKNPEFLNGDISSSQAIEHYYNAYYKEFEDLTDFNIDVGGQKTTIFDLLSLNEKGTAVYKAITKKKPNMLMKQAFKTAGEEFKVISENAASVLVPYKDGKKLIEEICSEKGVEDIPKMLRKIQKYSVGLPQNIINKDFVTQDDRTGIYILKEMYYDEKNYGFMQEPQTGGLFY